MCLCLCSTSSLFSWLFFNFKIALICAVGVFTNIANVLLQEVNDEEFIIVICQTGTIFTFARENNDKIRLGNSPLCSFFAKQMTHINMKVASSYQPQSPIQEASTERTQDGGVPESQDQDSSVVEASTEGTQDGLKPVNEVSTKGTQDGLEPVIEASTEATQDGGVPES